MSTPVQRLEALLQRVQDNRGKPRPMAPAPASAMAVPPMAAAPAPRPVSRDPRREPDPEPMELEIEELPMTAPPPAPMAPPQVGGPRQPAPRPGSPLEMAVAGELDRPPPPSTATPQGMPAPVPVAAPVVQAPVRSAGGNVETFSPEIPQPTKPIAQVVSKHAPAQAVTFGDLLRRSLSLRPR